MESSHFTLLFPLACAGFGMLLAGGANLALLRAGVAARALATAAAAGLALGGAAALDQPGVVTRTAQLLGAGAGGFLLLCWRGLTTRLAGAIAALRQPVVRFGLVTLAGVGVITGAVAYFQWADQKAMDESTAHLELLTSKPSSHPSATRAATDQGTSVVLREAESREGVDLASAEAQVLKNQGLDELVIRRGPADERSNCHGWVFTGGRYYLGPDEVALILKENGYQEVHQPQPGDVAIYRQHGIISHTALVRYVTEGQPILVEGKWGTLGVFLHPADRSGYGTDYTFYRSGRTGHLLAGLGGPATSTATQPVISE
ncbi:MAG TPA: hypothetical protein VM529_13700 [Gemmata sp.]|nr:hypothetical protein [Gemmata sp.]